MTRGLASLIFEGEVLFTTQEPQKEEVIREALATNVTLRKINEATLILSDNLNEEERALLLKILASVKHLKSEIVEQQHFGTYDFSDLSAVKQIISFGNHFESIHLSTPEAKYQISTQPNQKLILADTLSVINSNPNNEKRTLWNLLKLLFGM